MDNITLTDIVKIVIGFSTFLGSIGIITGIISKIYSNQVQKIVEPINKHLKEIDISQCKNFLVRFLADVEQGNEINEVERERAFEIYKHYIDLGGNSYIHNKWIKLMER